MAVRHARDADQKGGSIRRPATRQSPQGIALWLRGDNFFTQIDMNLILHVARASVRKSLHEAAITAQCFNTR